MRERINHKCALKKFLKEIVSKLLKSDATTGKHHIFVMESDSEEIAVGANVSSYDGPLPYNYEPPRRERDQAEVMGRVNGQRREIELWCVENWAGVLVSVHGL